MSESKRVRSHLQAAETNIRQFVQITSTDHVGQRSGQHAYKAIHELTQAIELINKKLEALDMQAAEK